MIYAIQKEWCMLFRKNGVCYLERMVYAIYYRGFTHERRKSGAPHKEWPEYKM